MTDDSPQRHPSLAAALLTVGGMVLMILTAVVLFGEGVEDGPLQVAMTLGLTLATVIAMVGGYTAEDLSAAMSKSINSALSTIFVLIAIGALIGSLFLSGTIATVIYYGAQYGSPKILYILVFVLASVLSYAIGSSFTTIAAVGLPFVALAPAMDVSPAVVAAAAVCGAFTGDGMGRISDTFILTSTVVGTEPGMYGAFTALNEHGVYIDLHDGTSMGGSVVYTERPPTLNTYADLMSETASLTGLVSRLNGVAQSVSSILTLADESGAVSMECSSMAGNRLRRPDGDSLVVVNTYLNPDWGLGQRETVSNSLRRFSNMTARLAEHPGAVDADITRDLMDLTLFDADGTFIENGGCTKPTLQDADSTNYQTVVDVQRRQLWMKVPAPDHFADWTHFDLAALWA